MQAGFLLQEFALALALDVERISVYKWVDEPALEPGFEPYGLLRHDRSPRPAYDAFRAITTYYAGTTDAVHLQRPELQQVILLRGDETTRVLWSRMPTGLRVSIPAIAPEALLVDQTGQAALLAAQNGHYTLDLPGAPCTPETGCLMGGPPLLLVEQGVPQGNDLAALGARVEGSLPPGEILPADSAGGEIGGLAQPAAGLTSGAALGVVLGALALLLGWAATAFWRQRRDAAGGTGPTA